MATLVGPAPKKHAAAGEEHLVPVYVWELPVRLSHWGIVAAVTVLTWTGLYMNHPFLIFPGPRSWTMGTVRFIHELAGFELIGALLVENGYVASQQAGSFHDLFLLNLSRGFGVHSIPPRLRASTPVTLLPVRASRW